MRREGPPRYPHITIGGKKIVDPGLPPDVAFHHYEQWQKPEVEILDITEAEAALLVQYLSHQAMSGNAAEAVLVQTFVARHCNWMLSAKGIKWPVDEIDGCRVPEGRQIRLEDLVKFKIVEGKIPVLASQTPDWNHNDLFIFYTAGMRWNECTDGSQESGRHFMKEAQMTFGKMGLKTKGSFEAVWDQLGTLTFRSLCAVCDFILSRDYVLPQFSRDKGFLRFGILTTQNAGLAVSKMMAELIEQSAFSYNDWANSCAWPIIKKERDAIKRAYSSRNRLVAWSYQLSAGQVNKTSLSSSSCPAMYTAFGFLFCLMKNGKRGQYIRRLSGVSTTDCLRQAIFWFLLYGSKAGIVEEDGINPGMGFGATVGKDITWTKDYFLAIQDVCDLCKGQSIGELVKAFDLFEHVEETRRGTLGEYIKENQGTWNEAQVDGDKKAKLITKVSVSRKRRLIARKHYMLNRLSSADVLAWRQNKMAEGSAPAPEDGARAAKRTRPDPDIYNLPIEDEDELLNLEIQQARDKGEALKD